MPEPPITERKPGMYLEEDGHWWPNGRWVSPNGYNAPRRQFYCQFEFRNSATRGPNTPGYLIRKVHGGYYEFIHLGDVLDRQRGAHA